MSTKPTVENPRADCGHFFLSEWNGARNPFPLPCDWAECDKKRCWRCMPCHDKDGKSLLPLSGFDDE